MQLFLARQKSGCVGLVSFHENCTSGSFLANFVFFFGSIFNIMIMFKQNMSWCALSLCQKKLIRVKCTVGAEGSSELLSLRIVRRYCHSASSGVNFHLFYFSETAERNSTKLDRKQDLNVLYHVFIFRVDQKNKVAAPASNLLRHSSVKPRNKSKLNRN